MTRESKTNSPNPKGRAFVLVVVFCVALLSTIANGQSKPGRTYSSSKALRSMARVYMAYGEYAKAQPLAEKALTLAQKRGACDSELAMCFIDLAVLYSGQGRPADAEKMCELGLHLQEKVLCKNHPYLAYTLRTLSSIYSEGGKYDRARSALDKAVTIMLDSNRADDKVMAPFYVDIAKLFVVEGDFEKAESYYQRAMALIVNSYGPDHLYTSNVLGSIAKLYILQGKYAEAEELINRAVAIQEKMYGPDHHLIAVSWLTKAKICQVKGDTAEAEKLIKRALDAVGRTGNVTAFMKLEQSVEEIRAGKQAAYGPIAKADK